MVQRTGKTLEAAYKAAASDAATLLLERCCTGKPKAGGPRRRPWTTSRPRLSQVKLC